MSGMVRPHPVWSALAVVAFAGGGARSGGGAGVDAGVIDGGHDVVSGGGVDAGGGGAVKTLQTMVNGPEFLSVDTTDIYWVTSGIWRVDGDKIALIRDRPPEGLK